MLRRRDSPSRRSYDRYSWRHRLELWANVSRMPPNSGPRAAVNLTTLSDSESLFASDQAIVDPYLDS